MQYYQDNKIPPASHDHPKRIPSKFIHILAVIIALCFIMSATLQAATQLSQFGITWIFNKDYQTGQFVNGDYWVIGPVTITGISPASTSTCRNGSMVNPSPTNNSQGYDSTMASNTYAASLNKALNVSSSNPLTLQAGSSLVSTISVPTAGATPQIQTAAILTVLRSAPAAGSFRPPYSGTDKTIRYNKRQLNYSLLKNLSPVSGTLSLAEVERDFECPWIDHRGGWVGRYQHPADNMPDYGDQISRQIGDGALMLHLNFTNAQKETLLIRYVQLGIDFYGIVQNGGTKNWTCDGGHASGRKWPIMFAGLMLNNSAMVNIGSYNTTGVHFGEDDQTFYVSQSDLNLRHYYNPSSKDYAEYMTVDLGLPEWGIKHATTPSCDGRNWDDAAYRTTNTANSWAGFVLAAQIMNQKAAWNHNALFDYQDRYMAVEKSLGHAGTGWKRQWSIFAENMWDTYRASYGSVWARTDASAASSDAYEQGLPITIKRFTIRAGKTQEMPGDSFTLIGTFDISQQDIADSNAAYVRLSNTSELVFEGVIPYNSAKLKNDKYSYTRHKGDAGNISSASFDLKHHTFRITASKVDLTGLSCPVNVAIEWGSYVEQVQADEAVINGKKPIPMQLLSGYADAIRIDKASVRNGEGINEDSLTVTGGIAFKSADILTQQPLTLHWDTEDFNMSAGEWVTSSNGKCTWKSPKGTAISIIRSRIDVEKCAFQIFIKNATIASKTGTIDCGITCGSYDQSVAYTLP